MINEPKEHNGLPLLPLYRRKSLTTTVERFVGKGEIIETRRRRRHGSLLTSLLACTSVETSD